jgi:uncharacterized protein (DUF2267 family)
MKVTGIASIDNAAQTVAAWLNEISGELGWSEKGRAYLLLRTVLHAVRDWQNVDEAADLAAQLPVLIRGIYFEGWNPSSTPVHPRTKGDFLLRIEGAFDKDPLEDVEKAIGAVLGMLEKHVSEGEIDQVRHAMRKQIRDLWPG